MFFAYNFKGGNMWQAMAYSTVGCGILIAMTTNNPFLGIGVGLGLISINIALVDIAQSLRIMSKR